MRVNVEFEFADYTISPTVLNVGLSLFQVELILSLVQIMDDRRNWNDINDANWDIVQAELATLIEELA